MVWWLKQPKKSPSLKDLSSSNETLVKDFQKAYNDYTLRGKYIVSIDSFTNNIDKYTPPKNPIVLCHGLSGFDQLILIPSMQKLINLIQNHIQILTADNDPMTPTELASIDPSNINNITTFLAIDYWIGIKKLLESKGCKVYITKVPSFGSIEQRALTLHKLFQKIPATSSHRKVKLNLIAHSMGGLDCRYLISRIPNNDKKNYQVVSLTTISTPHHGSEMADFVVEQFETLKQSLISDNTTLNQSILPLCFYQLSTTYMQNYFNHITPNDPNVAYFSYGAMFKPAWYNVFGISWQIINERSGGEQNDGMVTVKSAHWGQYLGTLYGLDHLDIINWQNKLIVKPPILASTSNPKQAMKVNLDILQFYLFITHNLAQHGF